MQTKAIRLALYMELSTGLSKCLSGELFWYQKDSNSLPWAQLCSLNPFYHSMKYPDGVLCPKLYSQSATWTFLTNQPKLQSLGSIKLRILQELR